MFSFSSPSRRTVVGSAEAFSAEEKMEAQTRMAAEQGEHVEDGQEKKSMFSSVKAKVKKINAKVKKNIRARRGQEENLENDGGVLEDEEEENDEEEQDQALQKSDENVVDVETLRAQNDPPVLNNKKDDTPIKEPIAKEDPNDGLFHFKETGQGRGETGNVVPITEIEETETDVGIPSTTEKAGDVKAEATEFTPENKINEVGEGNGLASNTKFQAGEVDAEATESTPQDKVIEAGEGNEFASNTKLQAGEVEAEATESTPKDNVGEVGEGNEFTSNTKPPNVSEEVKSGPSETGFGVVNKASGLAQELKGMFASKQSSDDDVKDTMLQGEHQGKKDEGPKQQQTEAGGVDNAKENLDGFESISGPKWDENPEEKESQNLARDNKGKVSEGEGAELASNTKPPNFTEEVNSGNSESTVLWGERQGKEDEGPQQQQSEAGEGYATGPNSGENPKEEESQISARKAQGKVSEDGEGNQLASETKPPNFTEEVKSGTPETGSGFMEKTSGSAQGLEGISPSDQSSNDNVKDTVLQGESKGQEDEGPHQQQSEAEAKAGQSYVQKLYAAIESKMGYGAQTNQETNVSRELKSGEPIQGPTSGTGTEATEDATEGKKSPVVDSFAGRNQGEETEIPPSSQN